MSSDFEQLRSHCEPLIVYVGPELSRSAGLPGRRELLATLLREAEDYLSARQLDELRELVAANDFDDAFTELERALSPAAFGRIVAQQLDDAACELPSLARAVAALRPRLRGVITPNLDMLLERAFEGTLTVHARPVADLPSRRDWLLKVHGTLHDRSTWLLGAAERGRALYRDALHVPLFRSLFMAHPILFVGTRLDDPVLVAVTEQIEALAHGQPPRHWALVDEREAGPVRRRKLAGAGISLIGCPGGGDASLAACVRMLGELVGTPVAVASARPAPTVEPTPLRILFLAANPTSTDPLRLDRELRIIREAIERSRHRAQLELEVRTAATVHDLRRALLERHYDVVHVSGHGEQDGLLLEDERGEEFQVSGPALAGLFARYAAPEGRLRCVLLNTCWSLATGKAISMGVPVTIAMDGPISDAGALEFSRGFYDALGAGLGFAEAYREGRSCVDLAVTNAQFVSVLLET
jgi:hypothetical protein